MSRSANQLRRPRVLVQILSAKRDLMLHTNSIIDICQPVDSWLASGLDATSQRFEAVAGFVRFGAKGLVGFAPGGDMWKVVYWGFAEEGASC